MSLFKRVQEDFAARLKSCPDFRHVDIQVQTGTGEKNVKALRDSLNRAIGGIRKTHGKSGLAVLVMLPVMKLRADNQSVPGPQMTLTLPIQILENSTINRGDKGTGISSEELAFTILGLGHLWQPDQATLFFAEETPMEPLETDEEMAADLAYQVNLAAPMGVEPLEKNQTPRLILHEGHCTLIGMPGQTLFYTLDGSLPWEGNKCAKPYDAPFAVTPGQRIRAAAYSENAVGSDAWEATA